MSTKEKQYISVSNLVQNFQNVLINQYPSVYLRAEISSCKIYGSGHAYLDLKDEKSLLSAVIWRSTLAKIKFSPEEGQEVLCHVSPNIYAPRGQLQVIVNSIQLAGAGDLQQQFLKLKEKLSKEGLFDLDRKREIPFLPKQIGIVTSESGAVIHDMSVKLEERMPSVKLFLYNARVQGDSAHKEIISGIKYFNTKQKVDLIIIARGGGSLEDLWPFNEEELVRAIFASKIPIISGVGHEPDVTLADLVADSRAPTPTAAAEMAVPKIEDLFMELDDYQQRLIDYQAWLAEYLQTLDFVEEKLKSCLRYFVEKINSKLKLASQSLKLIEPGSLIARKKLELQSYERQLAVLNPKNVLSRGYSLVSKNNKLLKSSKNIKLDDHLHVEFAEGSATVIVEKKND